jgi:hypothetical protein
LSIYYMKVYVKIYYEKLILFYKKTTFQRVFWLLMEKKNKIN